jgi:hypothetical protein
MNDIARPFWPCRPEKLGLEKQFLPGLLAKMKIEMAMDRSHAFET